MKFIHSKSILFSTSLFATSIILYLCFDHYFKNNTLSVFLEITSSIAFLRLLITMDHAQQLITSSVQKNTDLFCHELEKTDPLYINHFKEWLINQKNTKSIMTNYENRLQAEKDCDTFQSIIQSNDLESVKMKKHRRL